MQEKNGLAYFVSSSLIKKKKFNSFVNETLDIKARAFVYGWVVQYLQARPINLVKTEAP
jgi:hypothetical protein